MSTNSKQENQGEGDKKAAKAYNEEATKHANEADVEALARKAAKEEAATSGIVVSEIKPSTKN
tara:strand:- start:50837 stop:51025 length:189 start_codon:yes stop_codon:yes gene_type:complete